MPAVMDSVSALGDQLVSAKADNGKVDKMLDIIDIRSDKGEFDLKADFEAMFTPKDGGPRKLPTLLLYDERGLQLFEDITYLDEYYLTNAEIEVLKGCSAEWAEKTPAGSYIIELGSGNLRKVNILLEAFERLGKSVDYFALDLSRKELERTLAQVPDFQHVRCHGLLGTYEDGQRWVKEPDVLQRSKSIISLGSSIGNFHRHEAAEFLEAFANALQPTDFLAIGVDSCADPDKIYHAYNDRQGVTHQFILNGLAHINEIYGKEVFHIPDWRVIGEYVFDDKGGRHQAFVSPIRDVTVLGSTIQANDRIWIEQSLKYSKSGCERLFRSAGLSVSRSWTTGSGQHGIHLLQKAKMPFNLNPSLYAGTALPTLRDWEGLWEAWDSVTTGMIPQEELREKPIKLRNACIFYLGHIPTFLDIQLTKTTKEKPTDPGYYYSIFERGIDPDVDNPEQCHDHSEIPDEWPPVEDILAYQNRVRDRLQAIYAGGQDKIPRHVGRAIWLGFEHELMHIETLLYMMLQSDKTLPPPLAPLPNFEQMARKAAEVRVPNQWFSVPEQTITIGMDDPEDSTDPNENHGWDNEKPARQVKVHAFEAQGRPITNEEYAQYMIAADIDKFPASWSNEMPPTANGFANGIPLSKADSVPESFIHDKSVRTVYGLVPLKYALDWPVFASYDELAGCAAWMGGRIPSFEEAESIYAHVEQEKRNVAKSKLSNKVPAVNGHLINDGVEETPPSGASSHVNGSSPPAASELFIDLAGCNVGFTHWHPMPVTSRGGTLGGRAAMGGVWEWTSSAFEAHPGFEAMPMYPGYSADFFDEKHNIVLGGSWATHPRIAGRKSFVNWYQRNYPYAWVGARLVRDI